MQRTPLTSVGVELFIHNAIARARARSLAAGRLWGLSSTQPPTRERSWNTTSEPTRAASLSVIIGWPYYPGTKPQKGKRGVSLRELLHHIDISWRPGSTKTSFFFFSFSKTHRFSCLCTPFRFPTGLLRPKQKKKIPSRLYSSSSPHSGNRAQSQSLACVCVTSSFFLSFPSLEPFSYSVFVARHPGRALSGGMRLLWYSLYIYILCSSSSFPPTSFSLHHIRYIYIYKRKRERERAILCQHPKNPFGFSYRPFPGFPDHWLPFSLVIRLPD